jgi:hypothetical protein
LPGESHGVSIETFERIFRRWIEEHRRIIFDPTYKQPNNKLVKLGCKQCTTCKEIKPLNDYHNHKNGIGGKYIYCKKCSIIRAALYYRLKIPASTLSSDDPLVDTILLDIKIKRKIKDYDDKNLSNGMRYCTKCGETKKIADFPRADRRRDGIFPLCKQCRNNYVRMYRDNRGDRKQSSRYEYNKLFDSGYKQCTACKEIKQLTDYSPKAIRRKDSADVVIYKSLCKKCNSEHQRKIYYKNKGIEPPAVLTAIRDNLFSQGMSICDDCDKIKPLVDFPKDDNYRNGHKHLCKICYNHRAIEYRRLRNEKNQQH